MTKERLIEIIEECNRTDNIDLIIARTKEVVATRNPYFICDFAEFVTKSDHPQVMPKLEDGMIATGDLVHCYEFAFCMADHDKKFNLTRFEDLMIENKMAKLQYYFMECVKGRNGKKLFNSFVFCAPSKWLKAFEENKELACLNTAYNDQWLPAFTSYIECKEENTRNKEGFEARIARVKAALKSGNPLEINNAAEYDAESEEEIQELFEAMMATDDLLHIYELYCSVPALTDNQRTIILDYMRNSDQLNSAKYMYYVCAYTDLSAKEVAKMLESAKKTGNKEYIEKIEQVLQAKLEEESE